MLEYENIDEEYRVKGDVSGDFAVYSLEHEVSQNTEDYKRYVAIKRDLDYAKEYLDQMFYEESTSLIDGALINSSIQLLVRCFRNGGSGASRRPLDINKVFVKHAEKIGRPKLDEQFKQFLEARNKSIIHDEADYKDNLIGLTVDLGSNKAIEVTYVATRHTYLYRQNANLLKQMIDIAMDYVTCGLHALENDIIQEYNDGKYCNLSKMSAVNIDNRW